MKFSKITSPDDHRVQEIFNSYSTSFPEEERRDWHKFTQLFGHHRIEVVMVSREEENVGYLIVWKLSDCVFIEHFEVFLEFRNQKLGSNITHYLFTNYPKIILEVEPEDLNEDSKRRFSFYKRNGFSLIDGDYVQPSYGEGKKKLHLWLLANYFPENIKEIKDEIYNTVYL